MTNLRVAAAQIDAVVGDLDGNVARMLKAYEAAEAAGADLVAFPELAVTGYPPEDLLLRPAFVEQAGEALVKLAAGTGRPAAVVGFPERGAGGDPDRLSNAAAVCADGRVHAVYRKHHLPNYAVFDEQRYFAPGDDAGPLFVVGGVPVGVSICEDIWDPLGPAFRQAEAGARLLLNINASPYYAGRLAEREAMLAARARDAGVPIVYVNLVGGQDELVFDGASLVVHESGDVIARAHQFTEDLLVSDIGIPARPRPGSATRLSEIHVSEALLAPGTKTPRVENVYPPVQEVYEALVLGTRDYVEKNGFHDVLIGLSGGVDSSLVAVVAADALGPDRVTGVLMPSRFSSDHSVADAEALVANLGIRSHTIGIEPAHRAFEGMLAEVFAGTEPGLAEENLQARIRGTILMTMSNKFGAMVLTTGNKSELATGYSTLYGDMAGGFAVIKDVPKTLVYALCRDRNTREGRPLVPEEVLQKPPSAELRPDQRDSETLPDYDVLDPILEAYVERDRSVGELVAEGFDGSMVRRVVRLVDRNEYKRRQAPPGVRVSRKAFGKDRRPPITNRWPG
ncbi:MAG: NAD+ synthase [Acidimicrobiia bacterium]|nr:NAD+ synthase [Acidimicrobiia bacterium]